MKNFHAHLYFDKETISKAKAVISLAKDMPYFEVGRFHEKLVGPHPQYSCQLIFKTEDLDKVMIWLLENRNDLTWFIHPLSGDDLKDHKDHAIWIGKMYKLKLDIFN